MTTTERDPDDPEYMMSFQLARYIIKHKDELADKNGNIKVMINENDELYLPEKLPED